MSESELKKAGLAVQKEKALPIVYKDIRLDHGYGIDLLVENKVERVPPDRHGCAPAADQSEQRHTVRHNRTGTYEAATLECG